MERHCVGLECALYKLKKAILGDGNLPLPGGPCPVEHEGDTPPRQLDMVPTFYHEGPRELAMEVVHFLQAVSVLDMSPAGGHYAMEAVKNRIPYTGVCLSEPHKEELMKRLVSMTVTAMTNSNDKIYDAAFAEHVKEVSAVDGQEQNQQDQKNNGQDPTDPKGQTKGRGRGRGRGNGGRGSGRSGPGPVGPTPGTEDARAKLLARIKAEALKGGGEAGEGNAPGTE